MLYLLTDAYIPVKVLMTEVKFEFLKLVYVDLLKSLALDM